MGFSIEAPGEMKTEKGSYDAALSGKHEAVIYRSVDDNIEYKAIVVDFTPRAGEGAVLMGEATFLFQNKKKLLMDTFGRVDGLYGRKLTVDQPNNGGRLPVASFFLLLRRRSSPAPSLAAHAAYLPP